MPLMVGQQSLRGGVPISSCVPQTNGALTDLLGAAGQRVRLKIMDHLQFVLHIAEESIGLRQPSAVLGGQEMMSPELFESGQRIPFPHDAQATPIYDLDCLDDKLNFTDSARP
jgi:hypothetical protein